MKPASLLGPLALTFLALGCGRTPGPAHAALGATALAVSVPGATASAAFPHLASRGDSLVVLWTERGDSSRAHRLVYSVRTSGRWSSPDTVATGRDWFVNWADFPALAVLPGGRMVAHWLVRSAEGTYTYDVMLAWYDPSTQRWSKRTKLNTDGVAAEHGFVSYAPAPDGSVWIVWLDGRETARQAEEEAGGHGSPGAGAMTVRAARFDRAGERAEEHLLDARTCDCCQTAVAVGPSGAATVLYRDRSDDEIRDIAVARLQRGQWLPPQPLFPDGWRIDGCPVNGPSIAQSGEKLVAAWFTEARDLPSARVALSATGGEQFDRPIALNVGSAVGRMHALATPEAWRVSWIEGGADASRLRIARGGWDGRWGDVRTVDTLRSVRATGVPRMALVGDTLAIAWTSARGLELRLLSEAR